MTSASDSNFKWTQNEKGWKDQLAMRHQPLAAFSIHSLEATKSASKIGTDQYLALRILWDRHSNLKSRFIENILGRYHTEASILLHDRSSFQNYCDMLSERISYGKKGVSPLLGEFGQVLIDQLEVKAKTTKSNNFDTKVIVYPSPSPAVTRSRSKAKTPGQQPQTPLQLLHQRQLGMYRTPGTGAGRGRSTPDSWTSSSDSDESDDVPESPPSLEEIRILFPKSNDEETVNVALLNLLKAFHVFTPTSARWTNARGAFTVDLQNNTSYKARTDGCLRGLETKLTRGIVEVKPVKRESNLEAISRQEGAQMAAWIYSESLEDGDWQSEGQHQ